MCTDRMSHVKPTSLDRIGITAARVSAQKNAVRLRCHVLILSFPYHLVDREYAGFKAGSSAFSSLMASLQVLLATHKEGRR